MGFIKTLNGSVRNTQNVEVFVAATAAKNVHAPRLLFFQ
jgi:hypothetical protein